MFPLTVGNYSFTNISSNYESDNRKKFVYTIEGNYGAFFNGTRLNADVSAKLRFQPWGNFGLSYAYNDIKLAENYGERKIHLVRLNGDISFSNKISLKNVVQYNSQGGKP